MNQLVSIIPDQLVKGLYIKKARINRPHALLPASGVLVYSEHQISLYKAHAESLLIDVNQSDPELFDYCLNIQKSKLDNGILSLLGEENEVLKLKNSTPRGPSIKKQQTSYSLPKNQVDYKIERKQAQKLFKRLVHEISRLYKQMHRSSEPVSLHKLIQLADETVDSVINNKDALLFEAGVHYETYASTSLSIRASIWSILIGLSLKKGKEALINYALASFIAPAFYNKYTLGIIQKGIKRNESNQGVLSSLLNSTLNPIQEALKDRIVTFKGVGAHLEDWCGTGYPGTLNKNKIPLTAQIIGISLYYELIQNQNYAGIPLSPIEATKHLRLVSNLKFSDQIIERFIFIVHIYPTGAMVKLSTNEVALVVHQRDHNKLKPNLALVIDKDGQRIKKPKFIRLNDKRENRKIDSLLSRHDQNKFKVDQNSLVKKLSSN